MFSRPWRYRFKFPFTIYILTKYHFYVIDLFGHGKTASLHHYSPEKIILLLNELFEDLNLTRFYVLGHSYGGAIAILTALHLKDKVIQCLSLDGGYHDFHALYDYVSSHNNLQFLPKSINEDIEQCVKEIQQLSFPDQAACLSFYKEMNIDLSSEEIQEYYMIKKDGSLIYHLSIHEIPKILHFMYSLFEYLSSLDYSNSNILLFIATLPKEMDEI